MALLLTGDDLRPLLTEPELIAEGLSVIAESLWAEPDPAGTGHTSWLAFPLAEGEARLNIVALTTPRDATSLRLWPTDHGAAPDTALTLLFDRERGKLRALLGGDYLMWRTAGPVLVACRELAPSGTETLAMLGSGVQARYHLIGLRQVLPDLKRIMVFSQTEANCRSYAEQAAESSGLEVVPVGSVREAVDGADVVCNTAGWREQVLDPAWLKPGALVTEIAFGVSWGLPARVIVPGFEQPDNRPSGWPPHPQTQGWTPPRPAASLAQVLRGQALAREQDDETVLFIEHGQFAWEGALPEFAYQWACRNGVGTEIDV